MSTLNTTNLKHPSSGSNNIVLNTDGTTTIAAPSNIIKSGTAVASTSGTSIDFTGIPSWVKRVTVMFSEVSTNGTSNIQVQLGDAGGFETSGYFSTSSNTADITNLTSGIVFNDGTTIIAAAAYSGSLVFTLVSGNSFVASGCCIRQTSNSGSIAGTKTLSATLDRVRITTVNGTDTFDAGTINILWEG